MTDCRTLTSPTSRCRPAPARAPSRTPSTTCGRTCPPTPRRVGRGGRACVGVGVGVGLCYRLRMGAGCRGDGGTVGAMYYYGRAASAVRILTRVRPPQRAPRRADVLAPRPRPAPLAPRISPCAAQRLWLEQQLKSRQMVLQQQAVSAAAASAKTQREVGGSNSCSWGREGLRGCMGGSVHASAVGSPPASPAPPNIAPACSPALGAPAFHDPLPPGHSLLPCPPSPRSCTSATWCRAR